MNPIYGFEHRDFYSSFYVRGHQYKAGGFLDYNELSIKGHEALSRTYPHGNAIDGEAAVFFRDNLWVCDWPKDLRSCKLVTNERDSTNSCVKYFELVDGKLCMGWVDLEADWDDSYYIVYPRHIHVIHV